MTFICQGISSVSIVKFIPWLPGVEHVRRHVVPRSPIDVPRIGTANGYASIDQYAQKNENSKSTLSEIKNACKYDYRHYPSLRKT